MTGSPGAGAAGLTRGAAVSRCIGAVVAAAVIGGLAAAGARAAVPSAYAPIVVQPTGSPDKAEFDLTPAVARAAREGKRLYVYLGAAECPFCRRYEAFLDAHASELVPHFEGWLVVDLRSSLPTLADKLHIRVGAKSLPYAEFQASIGDERAQRLVYPSVWLFDAGLRPLMQMPAGTGTFQTVPEQLEILRLEQ